MNKKFQYLIIFASILSIIILTLNSIINRRYNFISIILVFLSCLPFYFSYENRKPAYKRSCCNKYYGYIDKLFLEFYLS